MEAKAQKTGKYKDQQAAAEARAVVDANEALALAAPRSFVGRVRVLSLASRGLTSFFPPHRTGV